MNPERWIRQVLAALLLGLFSLPPMTAQAVAVDLTGLNLTAKSSYTTLNRNSVRDHVTWTLQIYYGTKGTRFVLLQGSRGGVPLDISENRIVIKAGENRGSKRRKDNNFQSIITLDQSATSLKVTWESRGRDTRFANSKYIYFISLGAGSCRVDEFRYNADARMNYSRVDEEPGTCNLSRGVPADITNPD